MPAVRAAELAVPRSLGYLDREWDEEGWYWGSRLYPKRGRPFLFSIYGGLLVFALALVGAWREGRRCALWLAAAAFGFLLALGPRALLWSAARHVVPLFANIRYPERWILVAGFVLALLAARGFDAILDPASGPRRIGRSILAGFAVLFAAGAGSALILGARGGAGFERLGFPESVSGALGGVLARDLSFAAALAASGAVLVALTADPRRRTLAAAGVLALAGLDLVLAFRPFAPTESPDVLGAPPPVFQRLLARPPSGPIFHYAAYDRTTWRGGTRRSLPRSGARDDARGHSTPRLA